MLGQVVSAGQYLLLEGASGRRVLALADGQRFVWACDAGGELLQCSSPRGARERVLRSGVFVLASSDGGRHAPADGMEHLFLEEDGVFREFLLPHGVPTQLHDCRRIVATNEWVAWSDLFQEVAATPAQSRAQSPPDPARPRGRSPPRVAHRAGSPRDA